LELESDGTGLANAVESVRVAKDDQRRVWRRFQAGTSVILSLDMVLVHRLIGGGHGMETHEEGLEDQDLAELLEHAQEMAAFGEVG
jgi:hypothetical protein